MVYWPYIGCVNGKAKRGKRIILGDPDMPEGLIFKTLSQIQEYKTKTLEWLLSSFIASPAFKERGLKTQREQSDMYYPRIVDAISERTGNRLGDVPLWDITTAMLYRFLETQDGNTTRNKIKSLIGAAWSWAILTNDDIPQTSPTKELPRWEEKSRDRYVTDEDYRKIRRTLKPIYRAAMEIAYQCRARACEVMGLTEDDLLEEGIYIKRAKGSIPEITLWNRRLRTAVHMARQACNNPKSKQLFHDPDGCPISAKSWSARFKDCMTRRQASGKITAKERFTFHDLKAKGVSDHEGNYSGHKTQKGRKIYIRKAPKVKASR